jgi:hypothetical protein
VVVIGLRTGEPTGPHFFLGAAPRRAHSEAGQEPGAVACGPVGRDEPTRKNRAG